MTLVRATANGYYGSKIRSPYDKEPFGIADVEDFSVLWMDSDDPKVIAHVRKLAALKGDDQRHRARDAKDWLKRRELAVDDPDAIETRRVNIGGTDGVLGAEVPKPGQKLSAAQRVQAARDLTGREDITTAKEADAILAAAQPLAGSDNDDRSRDQAIDQTSTVTPAAEPDALDGPVTNVRIVDGDI